MSLLIKTSVLAIGCLVAGTLALRGPEGQLATERLRCEFLAQPLGVDVAAPELSWIVTSDARGQKQTAYRVLVASTREKLEQDQGDLWDSGKVDSADTFGIEYQGTPLASHQQCHWKVMAWDAAGKPGGWSEPSHWSVGLLQPDDWQGEWIGYDGLRHLKDTPPPVPLHGARWICYPRDSGDIADENKRVFQGLWNLPTAIASPHRARLAVSADDSCVVAINGHRVAECSDHQQPVTAEVGPYLHPGLNEVRVVVHNSRPSPTGMCLKLVLTDSYGENYVLTTDDRWFSLPNTEENWITRPFDGAPQAHVIGPFGMQPWGQPAVGRDVTLPPSYLRGGFSVDRPVRQATVYLASLGWADLFLNGEKVNDDYFSSGWTDYRKRVYYRAYDVTEQLVDGANAWGAVLTDGWYAGHVGWRTQRDLWGKKPRVRAMMRIEYEDGTTQTVATDRTWFVTHGPKKVADPLIGEEYDATLEVPGWANAGSHLEVVDAVDTGTEVNPAIEWHPGPPVVEVAEFPAKAVTQPVSGVYIYDIGQNIAGVARIKIQGKRGQRIQLRFGERLDDEGKLYTTNLRLARAIDYYTCKGDGVEVWQPSQTFHGFQYVELSGIEGQPPLEAVTGIALSSDTPLASEFDSSDANLNRLYQNILWTQRANFIDVPTDCPQRDERLGWTGDAQVYVHTACRVADVQAFFRKWLVDLTDAQRPDGQFPRVAPLMPGEHDGGPAWADAGTICPWEIYQAYGDVEQIARQYPSMVRFVDFCRKRSQDEVLPPENYHAFGDWLSINAQTPNDVIYMAYYARSVQLARDTATVLGKSEDARKYDELLRRIKAAFVENFVEPDGRIKGNTQCVYVLAIAYVLVEGEQRTQAANHLVADIEARGWKLSTGFIGTKDLMLALSEIGRQDVALRLLHQPEYPGWMFSISHGATSIWERWDGWTPDRGFQDPGMNSFAHYSFGAVYGWMVENLGGIKNTQPGFGKVVIEPTFDPALTQCRVVYDSLRGPIRTEWNVKGDEREYQVHIPANVGGTLKLRGRHIADVTVDGKPLADSSLVAQEQTSGEGSPVTEVQLPSGEYRFSMPK
jgi:alpha-L-rhamnosidase